MRRGELEHMVPPNQKDLYDVVSSGGGLRPLLSIIMFSFFFFFVSTALFNFAD